VIKKVLYI